MDLDLLKKLVNLANNNPNEPEANSAARRVCKMIAENNFQFIDGNSQPTQRPGFRAWDIVQQEMRRQQEEMLRRHAREAQERDRQYKEQRQRDREAYEAEQRRRQAREEEERKKTSPFNPTNWDWVYGQDPRNPRKPVFVKTCVGCDGSFTTREDIPIYVCDECKKRTETKQRQKEQQNKCKYCGRETGFRDIDTCVFCVMEGRR